MLPFNFSTLTSYVFFCAIRFSNITLYEYEGIEDGRDQLVSNHVFLYFTFYVICFVKVCSDFLLFLTGRSLEEICCCALFSRARKR